MNDEKCFLYRASTLKEEPVANFVPRDLTFWLGTRILGTK